MSARTGVEVEYRLLRDELPSDPLALFDRWYADAKSIEPERSGGLDRKLGGVGHSPTPIGEAEAMTLANVGDDGVPDARTVFLRGIEREPGREGFVFYTNYTSAKGRGLALQPACALLFYWGDLGGRSDFGGRQVRVRGIAERVSEATSDAYFATRPRLSQLGAWASTQSAVVGEDTLERELAEIDERFAGQPVTRPPHWGGYLVVAQSIELWQGRKGRLHDRFRYTRDASIASGWRIERLSP